jgi:hypothetical protein
MFAARISLDYFSVPAAMIFPKPPGDPGISAPPRRGHSRALLLR